jgi:transposase
VEGDLEALERRRLRAARMYERGFSQAEVARRLGVSRSSASRWAHLWEEGGRNALLRAGRAGRKPKLTPDQMNDIRRALARSPRAHGYPAEVWSASLLADLIRRKTGVSYHVGHLSRIQDQLGWKPRRSGPR